MSERILCISGYEFAVECAKALMGRRIQFRYEGKAGETYSLWVAYDDLRAASDAVDTVSFRYSELARGRIPEPRP